MNYIYTHVLSISQKNLNILHLNTRPVASITMRLCMSMCHLCYFFRFEMDDPFFTYIISEMDRINDTVGNGLLADIFPILQVGEPWNRERNSLICHKNEISFFLQYPCPGVAVDPVD